MMNSTTIVMFTITLIVASCASISSAQDDRDLIRAVLEGGNLSEEEAAKLEQQLRTTPNDLRTRATVLGYYWKSRFADPKNANKHASHALWFSEHRPKLDLTGRPFCILDDDSPHFPAAKALWQKHLDSAGDDAAILVNAARFFGQSDSARAEAIYRKLQSLQPDNHKWPEALANLHELRRRSAGEDKAHEHAQKALIEQEKALALAESKEQQFYVLSQLPEYAFNAGDMLKAREFAEKLLVEAEAHKRNWNYGNAKHHAHTTLGRAALNALEIHVAKEHLIFSGKTPGSPQLNSFGPSFKLADALLERGEKDAVLQYLKDCESFWEMGRDELKAWQEAIRAGNEVDFGQHLQR